MSGSEEEDPWAYHPGEYPPPVDMYYPPRRPGGEDKGESSDGNSEFPTRPRQARNSRPPTAQRRSHIVEYQMGQAPAPVPPPPQQRPQRPKKTRAPKKYDQDYPPQYKPLVAEANFSAPRKWPKRDQDEDSEAESAHQGHSLHPDYVDWKTEVCQAIGAGIDAPDHIILEALETLHLRGSHGPPEPKSTSSYSILYRVKCAENDGEHAQVFADAPYYTSGDIKNDHLHARSIVSNLELYIERQLGISFIIYKDYECCSGHPMRKDDDEPPPPVAESMYIVSEYFLDGLKKMARRCSRKELFPNFEMGVEYKAPYLWLYHNRDSISSMKSVIKGEHRKHLRVFIAYIEEHIDQEYSAVDEYLEEGKITKQLLNYIFVPGEVVLLSDKIRGEAHDRVYTQQGWLEPEKTSSNDGDKFSLNVFEWKYDGSFQKSPTSLTFNIKTKPDEPILIQNLTAYPLRYAERGKTDSLRNRGRKFWNARFTQYVSYEGYDFTNTEHIRGVRFMIDITTYKRMHPNAPPFERPHRDDLGSTVMNQTDPPSEDFLLLLPPNVYGYNMHERKWMNLLVDNILPINWNQNAFDTLVLEEHNKDVLKALVTNKMDTAISSDMISGKANGLIILLHGGPGTGKTLTAESVAEYAKKPLYRVTCGDIGTKPEEVEKQLSVILNLGKTWDCVVLLDEAEVFLQQRSLLDIQRNALVSVFLRVLECYDGILVMTSNRVAAFDETVKSRIQFALYFERLKAPQRMSIWDNLIKRLDAVKDNVDMGNLQKNLHQLAKYDLNGRQIRHVLTTARQLGKFKDKKVDFGLLQHVIQITGKFDQYMKLVNENGEEEPAAKGQGLR